MNKFIVILSTAVIFVSTACFKSPETTPKKPTQSSTPTAEKSASPGSSSTSKSGNYEQALNDFKAKNYDKAETGFKEVIASEPKNADAHFYLGKISVERKDYQASVPYFVEASKIDYKSVEKLMALGDAYFELKKFDTAIVQYGKIQGFEPNNADACYKMGLTYIGLNNKIAASQQLKRLEPLNKNLAEKLKKEIDKL